MCHRAFVLLISFLVLSTDLFAAASSSRPASTDHPPIGLYFEPNLGQASSNVEFVARGSGGTTLITRESVVFRLSRQSSSAPTAEGRPSFESLDVKLTFNGGRAVSEFEPSEKQPGVSGYFPGNDRSTWLPSVPHYGKLRARNVYEGIDVVYYAKDSQLEYDLVISPGADASLIRLGFEGLESVLKDEDGNLILNSRFGPITHAKPFAYQLVDGKKVEVESHYRVDHGEVQIVMGDYDESLELTIDPVLQFGVTFQNFVIESVATDSAGATYLTGTVTRNDTLVNPAPGTPPADDSYLSSYGYAAKIEWEPSSRRANLVYATYLGKGMWVSDLAVDSAGAAYIVGEATNFFSPDSLNIPLVNALPAQQIPQIATFIMKLAFDSPSRSLRIVYSTRIGPATYLGGSAVALGPQGEAYVLETVCEAPCAWPSVNPIPEFAGAISGASLTKLNFNAQSNTLSVAFSTLIPGFQPQSIAVDPRNGAIHLAGNVHDESYRIVNRLILPIYTPSEPVKFSAAVMRIHVTGNIPSIAYSIQLLRAFVGGSAKTIAVAADGSAILCATMQRDYPIEAYNLNQLPNGGRRGHTNVMVSSLIFDEVARTVRFGFSTVFGGSTHQSCTSVAAGRNGSIYIAGQTNSKDFPMIAPMADMPFSDPYRSEPERAIGFVARLDTAPSLSLGFSTPVTHVGSGAGPFSKMTLGIAADPSGNITVATNPRTAWEWYPLLGEVSVVRTTPDVYSRSYVARLVDGAAMSTPALSIFVTGHGTVAGGGPGGNIFCARPCVQYGAGTYRLNAMPGSSALFLGWEGACSGFGVCEITPDRARFVTARFTFEMSVNIRALGSGSGMVSGVATGGEAVVAGASFRCAPPCTGTVVPRGTYMVEAIPNPGSRFTGWRGNDPAYCDRQDSCPYGQYGSAVLEAVFELIPTEPAKGLHFVPIAPVRVLDTRLPWNNGEFRFKPLESRTTPRCAGAGAGPQAALAKACSLNVTVIPDEPLAYVTAFPAGSARPNASTLNSLDARIKANAAIVPAGVDGSIKVFATHRTEVVLDASGYFIEPELAPAGQGLVFYPLTPCRILDTRSPAGPLGGPAFQGTRTIPIRSSNCGVPAPARAYSLNATVVPDGPLSYITLFPTGQRIPEVSTLNALTGTITANAAIVPAGTDGSIDLNVSYDRAPHAILDINGYFAPPGSPGGLRFFPITPCRVLDTRDPVGPFGGPIMGALETREFPFPQSTCNIPAAAKAYSINVTVVPTRDLPYLTLWPAGVSMPVVSTLNSLDGSIVSNAAIVPAGTGGAIRAFTVSPTHMIFDVNGYFAP